MHVNETIFEYNIRKFRNHKIEHKIYFDIMKIPNCILALLTATYDSAYAGSLRASVKSVIKPLNQDNHGYIGIEIDHVIGMLTDNCNEIVVKAFDSATKKVLGIDDMSSEVDAVYVVPNAKSNNFGTDVSWWTPRGFLWHMTFVSVLNIEN